MKNSGFECKILIWLKKIYKNFLKFIFLLSKVVYNVKEFFRILKKIYKKREFFAKSLKKFTKIYLIRRKNERDKSHKYGIWCRECSHKFSKRRQICRHSEFGCGKHGKFGGGRHDKHAKFSHKQHTQTKWHFENAPDFMVHKNSFVLNFSKFLRFWNRVEREFEKNL